MIINVYLDELSRNGVSISCVNLVNELAKSNYTVRLHVYGKVDESLFVDYRVQVISHTHITGMNRMLNVISFYLVKPRKRRYKKQSEIHLAYSFLNIGMKRDFFKARGKHIMMIHGDLLHGYEYYNKGVLKTIFRKNLNFLAASNNVICLTESAKIRALKLINYKLNDVVVIHNIYHLPQQITHKVKRSRSFIKLIYVGRIEKNKGMDLLLDIVQELSKEKTVYCTIVGSGSYEVELKEKIFDQALQNCFIFPGFAKDVIPYLYESDYFVFPSESEGWPTVLMDALSVGCKVIASDIIGNRDVLTYNNKKYGYLVARNAQDFVNVINADFHKSVKFDTFDFLSFNQDQLNRWSDVFKCQKKKK